LNEAHGAAPVRVVVNGRAADLALPRATPLLQVLRNDLALNGPKYGCGYGECGACMVLIDGRAARACVLPLAAAEGREVTTLDGLAALDGPGGPAGADGQLHLVQQAFIDAQAAQCGYCLNGMIIATVALLRDEPDPSEARIRSALSHNLCRCGTHLEILAAVRLAAERMRGRA